MSRAPGHRIISLASRLVPAERRDAWRREWQAEAAWAWAEMERRGGATYPQRARLRLRAMNCVIDAMVERSEGMTMTGMTDDLRLAARSLLRRPGFTAVAVATIALGIGANTAVFTLVDGVLLRPLPFDRPDELVSLEHLGRDGQDELPISTGLYLLYRDQARSLESVAAFTATAGNLVADGEAERLQGQAVTPTFFDVFGVGAVRGRTFTAEEGQPGGEQVVVLSDGLWRTRFGADPGVIGTSLDLSGTSRVVIGVMPPEFGYPDARSRFWIPFVIDEANAPLAAFYPAGIARMAPGQTLAGVDRELAGMNGRLSELFPGDGAAGFLEGVGLRPRIRLLKTSLVGDVSTTLWILLGTVAFVLLIACANVANLLLVRAESRTRELALRVAVGASRGDVLRTFMSESFVLAAAGAALGVGIASVAVRFTSRYLPSDLPRMDEVGLDPRVLAFTAVLALGCALFFGLFPLLRQGTDDLAGSLREGGARGSTGAASNRLRSALVVTQVALALVLLIGSGLMFRSFLALRSVDPGFEREGVATARVIVSSGEIPGWEETDAFFRQLRERLAAQPGVTAVGAGTGVPLGGNASFGGIELEDHPRGPEELPIFAAQTQASPGYFEALGVDLVEGRTFREDDGAEGNRSVVINRTFAEEWWPGASPLGRGVGGGGPDSPWYRVVGVVDDVRTRGLDQEVQGTVYYPTLGEGPDGPVAARGLDLVVRTTGDPLELIPVLRRELRALNPSIPLTAPRTMEDVFQESTARTSFTVGVLGVASGIALLLGVVGIYGVISYLVSQRTREIGVRMALGATAPSVRRMVVRQGLVLAGLGVMVGMVAAGALSRLMGSLLFGVEATDPVTYGAVALVLVAVASLASWLPALRAAGVDPSTALRGE